MRIAVLSEVDPGALERLQEQHEVRDARGASQDELEGAVADADVVVLRSGVELSRELLQAGNRLQLVVRAGSGLDNIDLPTAQERGISVVRIPGPSARAVAELTLGLMLAVARNIVVADASMRRGEWRKTELAGQLLRGKTAGVVGLGNIGGAVAELCVAMGMQVLGCLPDPTEMTVRRFRAAGVEVVALDELVARSDFVTLHVPLEATTRRMVDDRFLAAMRRGAYLINTSRGGVVDEPALARALQRPDGIAGAALDVHASEGARSPLADDPRVVLTPHLGSMAVEAQAEIGLRLVQMVAGFEQGRLEEMLTEHERVA